MDLSSWAAALGPWAAILLVGMFVLALMALCRAPEGYHDSTDSGADDWSGGD